MNNVRIKVSATKVALSVNLESEDYGLKASINANLQQSGHSMVDSLYHVIRRFMISLIHLYTSDPLG